MSKHRRRRVRRAREADRRKRERRWQAAVLYLERWLAKGLRIVQFEPRRPLVIFR